MVNVSKISKRNEDLLLIKRFIKRSLTLLGTLKWLSLQNFEEKERAYKIYKHFSGLRIDFNYMEELLNTRVVEKIIMLAKKYYEEPSNESILELEQDIEESLNLLQNRWGKTRLN